MKVVGVAEHHLRLAGLFEVQRRDGSLDGTGRRHVLERRRLHRPVDGDELTAARRAFGFQYFKHVFPLIWWENFLQKLRLAAKVALRRLLTSNQ